MRKHWLIRLLALVVTAALLSYGAALAEGIDDVEIILPDAVVAETEVELAGPDDAGSVESVAKNKPVPENGLSVSQANVTTRIGESVKVVVTLTLDGGMSWHSGDEDIASCEWGPTWHGDDLNLYIYGNGRGSTTITVTSNASGDSVEIKVKVKKGSSGAYSGKGKKDGTAKYRALLIGEEDFDEICTRNRGDVDLMKKMLKSVKGSEGGSWSVTTKIDLNSQGVLNAIRSKFKNADEDDRSLFFIATHGDIVSSGEYAGALAMIPEGWLYMDELAEALKAVPGRVIVIIESCGSGAAVYVDDESQNAKVSKNAMKSAANSFDNAVINAFSKADPGIVDGDAHSSVEKGGVQANTGELRRKNKFYVLAASRYQEESWGTESGPYNYFTKWLTNGVGTSGRMPADSNKNGKVTLKELFKYISKVGDNYPFRYEGINYYQHVQVYPKNSSINLFTR